MTQKTLHYDELGVTPSDVYAQIGYRDAVPDQATQTEVQALVDDMRRWLRPQFCYLTVPQLPAFNMGPIILRQLGDSEAYSLFIATAGCEYDDFMARLKDDGDMVRLFIADALGSVVAERCADCMEVSLQQSIDKLGWHHTNRFSPGYCGWHVSEQQLLFPLFQGHTCGVTLNDSSLMLPIKSVSGIIGIGKKVRKQEYTCGLCNMKQCYKRIKPIAPTCP